MLERILRVLFPTTVARIENTISERVQSHKAVDMLDRTITIREERSIGKKVIAVSNERTHCIGIIVGYTDGSRGLAIIKTSSDENFYAGGKLIEYSDLNLSIVEQVGAENTYKFLTSVVR